LLSGREDSQSAGKIVGIGTFSKDKEDVGEPMVDGRSIFGRGAKNIKVHERLGYIRIRMYLLNKNRRNTMKSSMNDKAKGTFHQVKGKVKEMAGKISDNPKMEAEGKVEKIAGKVQEKVGQVKKVLGK
jgi:uncharacterized protein YjbJ (UPF0337 family)